MSSRDTVPQSTDVWRAFLMTALRYAILAVALFATTGTVSAQDNVVIQWDKAALQSVRDVRPGPPMAARGLAIVHTCIFDAWTAYDAHAISTRLGSQLRRPASERTAANKNQAISFAAFRCLSDLFPSEVSKYRDLMTSLGYNPQDISTDLSTPTGIGNFAAVAVIIFRQQDGSNQLGDLHPGPYADYTGYVPLNDPDNINNPDHWQPLRVPDGNGGFKIQTYIGPFWGKVTPFALRSGSQFRPALPPTSYYTSPLNYALQAKQILAYSAGLTDTQKMIAEYWADGPGSELPPGHWCLFGQFISARDHHDLDADVKMFFAASNALLDASIVAWDAKRSYDSVRPITAIHYLFNGQQVLAWAGPYKGTQLIDGSEWQPYQAATFITPAFPEYISGHSTFSAACAEVFRRFTHSDYFGNTVTLQAGTSKFEAGAVPATDITLSWATFSAAADQAGLSRRFGGIHFAQGDLVGRFLGRLVGAQAWRKAQHYIHGDTSDRDDRKDNDVGNLETNLTR
jgi:hypothetical protein